MARLDTGLGDSASDVFVLRPSCTFFIFSLRSLPLSLLDLRVWSLFSAISPYQRRCRFDKGGCLVLNIPPAASQILALLRVRSKSVLCYALRYYCERSNRRQDGSCKHSDPERGPRILRDAPHSRGGCAVHTFSVRTHIRVIPSVGVMNHWI